MSIVVCVRGALEHVTRLVEYLGADDGRDIEVLLVDDANGGSATARLRSLAATYDMGYVGLAERHWYVRAANIGVESASGGVVILLNSDALLSRESARRLATAIRSAPFSLMGPVSNAAGYQSIPRAVGKDGKFMVSALPRGMSAWELEVHWRAMHADVKFDFPLVNGFCMAFSRTDFLDIGGFDSRSFPLGYGEEYDLAIRWQRDGGRLAVCGDTYAYHAKSRSFGRTRRADLVSQAQAALGAKHGTVTLARLREAAFRSTDMAALRREMQAVYRAQLQAFGPISVPRSAE